MSMTAYSSYTNYYMMTKGGQGHFLQRENHLMGVILELSKVYNIGLATNGVIGNPMKTNDTKKAKKKKEKYGNRKKQN